MVASFIYLLLHMCESVYKLPISTSFGRPYEDTYYRRDSAYRSSYLAATLCMTSGGAKPALLN